MSTPSQKVPHVFGTTRSFRRPNQQCLPLLFVNVLCHRRPPAITTTPKQPLMFDSTLRIHGLRTRHSTFVDYGLDTFGSRTTGLTLCVHRPLVHQFIKKLWSCAPRLSRTTSATFPLLNLHAFPQAWLSWQSSCAFN